MVIIGKTPNELQQSLDLLKSYCDTWGLEVNTDKTKIVVFRKRGPVFEMRNGYIIIKISKL